jgi:octaprenyl-diphosphate synthase
MGAGRDELDQISAPVAEEIALLNRSFRGFLGTDVPLINQVFDHLLEGGGKRIRPLLVLLTGGLLAEAGAGAPPQDKLFRLAAALEFIHTSSLLHDDVVDQSDLRRGKRAAHRMWGVEPSILCGDYLFSRAFSLLVENGDLPLLTVVSAATTGMARGEVLQLLRSYSTGTSEREYLEVIDGKTACLISACSEGAACLGGAGGEPRARLARFGRQLGLAFQVADDLLDYTATEQEMGKARGHDFLEGKFTLPAIYLMEDAATADRAAIRDAFLAEEPREADLARILSLMERHGSIARARRTAGELADRAVAELGGFADGPCRRRLADLARYVVGRGA